MKKLLLVVVTALLFGACNNIKKEDTKKVLIQTKYGDMKVELFNETPKHRDNFVKLVNDEFYDSLLFHRVINTFMIQGGDPQSKGAEKDAMLGNGGPGYKIDAEIIEGLHHTKGALAAAREGDRTNPDK
ncbi:MAG: peptidylprolyl isomerase, partial [Bacteroidota bacterium]|nr:peptidylprolyl isomerase [Bacteroidota bacterium]